MITIHYGHQLSVYYDDGIIEGVFAIPCFLSKEAAHSDNWIEAEINGIQHSYTFGVPDAEGVEYIALEDTQSYLIIIAALAQLPFTEIREVTIVANKEYTEKLASELTNLKALVTRTGHQIRIQLDTVRVLPEITAGVYDLCLKRKDRELVEREDLLKSVNLIISINSRETDWVLLDGLTILDGGTFYFSINTILVELKDYYYQKTGKSLGPSAAMIALATNEIKISSIKKEKVDQISSIGKDKLTQKAIDAVNNLSLIKNPDRIIITGEGAAYLEPNHQDLLAANDIQTFKTANYALLRGSVIINALQGYGGH